MNYSQFYYITFHAFLEEAPDLSDSAEICSFAFLVLTNSFCKRKANKLHKTEIIATTKYTMEKIMYLM